MMAGAGADLFNRTCFNYPTLGDLYKYATYAAIPILYDIYCLMLSNQQTSRQSCEVLGPPTNGMLTLISGGEFCASRGVSHAGVSVIQWMIQRFISSFLILRGSHWPADVCILTPLTRPR